MKTWQIVFVMVAILGIVGSIAAVTSIRYQATDPTSYTYTATGVAYRRGEARFDVTWDTKGRNPVKIFNLGRLDPGETSTQTFYIINRSSRPLNVSFSTSNPSWPTTDPSRDLTIQFICAREPLNPGQARRVYFKITCNRWLASPNNSFSFTVTITGTLTTRTSRG